MSWLSDTFLPPNFLSTLPDASSRQGLIVVQGPPGCQLPHPNQANHHLTLNPITATAYHILQKSCPQYSTQSEDRPFWCVTPSSPLKDKYHNTQPTPPLKLIHPNQWLNQLAKHLQLNIQCASSLEIQANLNHIAQEYAATLPNTNPLRPLYENPDTLSVAFSQWEEATFQQVKPDELEWFLPLTKPLVDALARENRKPRAQLTSTILQALLHHQHSKQPLNTTLPPVIIEHWEHTPLLIQKITLSLCTISNTSPIITTVTDYPTGNLLSLPPAAHLIVLPPEVTRPYQSDVAKTLWPQKTELEHSTSFTEQAQNVIQGSYLSTPTTLDALERCIVDWITNNTNSPLEHPTQLTVIFPDSFAHHTDNIKREASKPTTSTSLSIHTVQHLQRTVQKALATQHGEGIEYQIIDHTQCEQPREWPILGLLETLLSLKENTKPETIIKTLQANHPEFASESEHIQVESLTQVLSRAQQAPQQPNTFSQWAWDALRCFPDVQEQLSKNPKHIATLQAGFQHLDQLPSTLCWEWLNNPENLYTPWQNYQQPNIKSNAKTLSNSLSNTPSIHPTLTLHWHTPTTLQYTLKKDSTNRFNHALWLDADTLAEELIHRPQQPLQPVEQDQQTNPTSRLNNTQALYSYVATASQSVSLIRIQPTQEKTEIVQSPLWRDLEASIPDLFQEPNQKAPQETPPQDPQPNLQDEPIPPWQAWEKQLSSTPVIETNEALSISASGLNNYMRCPRQYFYSQLLQLRGEPNDKAQAGTLMHLLLEALNTVFPKQPYTADTLHNLFQQYLNPESELTFNPSHELFTDADRALYFERNQAEQADLKRRITQTIHDLEQSGYFADLNPTVTLGEQRFRFTHPKIKHTQFQGSIDALIGITSEKNNEQSWHVLDYKHESPTKWRSKEATHLKHLSTSLTPLPDDGTAPHDMPHETRFKDQNKRNHQIPLYYWATQYDESLQNKLKTTQKTTNNTVETNPSPKINQVGLQVVRPPIDGPNGEHIGSQRIALLSSEIRDAEKTVVHNIDTHILQPIRHHATFPTEHGNQCAYCPHRYLCPNPHALDSH